VNGADLRAVLADWLAMPLVQMNVSLATAFVLGTAIGFERQWRQRNAGLRTNVLVCIGAAAFSALGIRLLGMDGGTRIIAYVVSGIGFLGAGVILKDGGTVRGLNTAATLWCSAAVGAFAGSGLPGEAASLTVFVLAGNTLLRPLVNWVNRRPTADSGTEQRYSVLVTCRQADRRSRPAGRYARSRELSGPGHRGHSRQRPAHRTRGDAHLARGGCRRVGRADGPAGTVPHDRERDLGVEHHRVADQSRVHGRPSACHPATVPRSPRPSGGPSNPSAML
jgi:uncharacterized membrane protein YhiD involved in acid resistance